MLFHIDPDKGPDRLALLVTVYLIAANVYGVVSAPKDRGFSFIEIWMVGIQITILLALFEYAVVLVLKRRNKNLDAGAGDASIKSMDKYTELASMVFFFIFNICYWTIAILKK